MDKSPHSPSSFGVFDNDLDTSWHELFTQGKTIAVDTETMGLVHGRDRLCLIQICDEKDNVACIKINQGHNSSPKLKNLLENKTIEKVFHYARFDVASLKTGLNINVNPIFCTKIGSKLARTYTPRHGLKDLVFELTGVQLDKSAQSSDWGKVGDLSENQLIYAANDVRYLLTVKAKLEKMLKRELRWDLAKRCFDCIPVIADLDVYKFNQTFEH